MRFHPILSSGTIFVSLLFLFTVLSHSIYAQQHFEPSLYSVRGETPPFRLQPVQGTLHIVAIMVEFQPDDNRFTSGIGTFEPGAVPYLENPGTTLDALPHDRGFFESRLEFTRNYFERMSNEMLTVEYTVLPNIYRLPNPMREYSPVGEDPELDPLARLAMDAWQLVEAGGELNLGLNSSDNIAFIVFHAGIGRDIELTGTTLDRTPQDIPSVYLSRNAIARLLDDPGFSGFPIDNGNLLVNNTLILPRTLTRSGEDVTGNRFVIPLSANGMTTAQIGSHLGLPDLFNTETGESGIGRFGLMDGAGIFAYNGLFPPEMSAFEKVWLGWAEPFNVDYDETGPVSLPAASSRQPNSIARISLSGQEYFLVENRHRDPSGDGVTLTIRRPDESLAVQTFSNMDTEFVNQEPGFDELLEPGLVINVSNYDFALPGGFDPGEDGTAGTDDDRELNGGILIWHVDESVINNKIGRAGINSDPDRRAVNLQEADGAQDIGRPVQVGLFENPVNGSPFDFWWSSNDATVITQTGRQISLYENRFGPDTTPDNRSNSGAPSFFELYGFSDNLPVAQFSIRPANLFSGFYELVDEGTLLSVNTVNPVGDKYLIRYPLTMVPFSEDPFDHFLIPGPDGYRVYDITNREAQQTLTSGTSTQQPLITREPAGSFLMIAGNPLQTARSLNADLFTFDNGEWQLEESISTEANSGFISRSQESIIDFDRSGTSFNLISRELVDMENGVSFRSEQIGQFRSEIDNGTLILRFPGGAATHAVNLSNENERVHSGVIDLPGQDALFYLLTDSRLTLYGSDSGFEEGVLAAESGFLGWPAIADVNNNGSPDLLFVDHSRNRLAAVNRNGGFLDGFPLSAPSGSRFTGTPLIADLNGDGDQNLLIAVQDQFSLNIMAYGIDGEPLEGFPLYVGGVTDEQDHPINPALLPPYLAAVSHTSELKLWRFPEMGEVRWAAAYGNDLNNKVTGRVTGEVQQPDGFILLNRDETYNWPNPAANETYLRFQTNGPLEVKIRISTLSGRTIYDRVISSRGGPPEEILINTSAWASGAYFARLTASDGSRTETKIVRIAIAK